MYRIGRRSLLHSASGCQNPSLTYMALSAGAAHHPTEFVKTGKI